MRQPGVALAHDGLIFPVEFVDLDPGGNRHVIVEVKSRLFSDGDILTIAT